LAANTVAKAYRALEADGVIETRGRNGTLVAAAGSAAEREAATAAQGYAERARRLGLSEEDALAAVRDALRAAYGTRADRPAPGTDSGAARGTGPPRQAGAGSRGVRVTSSPAARAVRAKTAASTTAAASGSLLK